MGDPIQRLLDVDDAELARHWNRIERWLRRRFDRDVTIEAVLFLIGIQSRGRGFEPEMEKESKQQVIMEGTCCAFETIGLYRRIGLDEDGSWIWERAVDTGDALSVDQQEKLLRLGIVRYFDDVLDGTNDTGDGPRLPSDAP